MIAGGIIFNFINKVTRNDTLFNTLPAPIPSSSPTPILRKYTFNKKSYHREKESASKWKVKGLNYSDGLNLELGLKYKFFKFNVTITYELGKSKNDVFKVGFEAEFW